MQLGNLIDKEGLSVSLSSLEVGHLTADSRQVRKGTLFFALKGHKTDGCAFVQQAIHQGCVAVVSDQTIDLAQHATPFIQVDDARHALAVAAARYFAGQPENVVAVTGTSGKTSVVSFVRQMWARHGIAGASIGTLGMHTPQYVTDGTLTTPDAVQLQQTLKKIMAEGVTHLAIEASSHGLDQRRLDGVKLCAAAFTNLGRDHMDYHENVDDYFKTKMRLFDALLPQDQPAIVFADDDYSQRAIDHIKQAKRPVLTVGQKGEFIQLKRAEPERDQQNVELVIDGRAYAVTVPLIGHFQISNAIVAAGLALTTGVPADAVMHAMEQLEGAPGRLQLVGRKNDEASIYLDYAHKPEALENILHALRPFTKGRLIVVFGCGGDRDKGKRPLMGAIAAKLADVVVITDDNPRSEVPGTIRQEIKQAAPEALDIGSRREAIRHAVSMLQAHDVLVVAGKGHETGQIIAEQTLPFSDQKEILQALEEN